MKKYRVIVVPRAQQDLKAHLDYIKKEFKNPKAAQNVYDDFVKTKKALALTAESIQEQSSEILKQRGLKRINFRNHGYFMLFCIFDGVVRITNIFHDLEDYERKLNE